MWNFPFSFQEKKHRKEMLFACLLATVFFIDKLIEEQGQRDLSLIDRQCILHIKVEVMNRIKE